MSSRHCNEDENGRSKIKAATKVVGARSPRPFSHISKSAKVHACPVSCEARYTGPGPMVVSFDLSSTIYVLSCKGSLHWLRLGLRHAI